MADLDTKRFKCALNLSSMVAEAASSEDAGVMFRCPDCSMQKLERCAGPVECAAPKKPIVVMPKTKKSPEPPKRRGRKPKESPSPEARRDMAREVVRTFRSEIAEARKAGCGWERLSRTLRRFGYEIGEYALQKSFEEMQRA